MAFFLIVPSVMIVSVLLVHALANRLGLRIYYTTLLAVAVLSFMVTFATTFITPTISREFLLRLGLMILATSAILTFANKFLLNKQLAEEKRFDEEVRAAYEEEKRKSLTDKDAPPDKFEWGDENASLAERNFLHEEPLTPAYNELTGKKTSPATDTDLDDKETLTATDTDLDDKETSPAADTDLDDKETSTTADTVLDDKEPSPAADTDLDDKETSTTADTVLDDKEPSPAADTDIADKETSTTADTDIADKETSPAADTVLDDKEPSPAADTVLDDKEPSPAADNDLADKESSPAADNDLADKESSTTADTVLDDKESSTTADTVLDDKEPLPATDTNLDDKETLPVADTDLDDKETSTTAGTDLAESLEPLENFPLEKVFEALPEVKSAEADKPIKLEEKKEPVEEFPLEEVFKPLSTVKPEEIEKPTEQQSEPADKKVKRTEFFPLQEVFRPLSTLKLDKLEEFAKEEPPEDEPKSIDNDTLDDILDKAYNERDKGHVWQAIELYKKALERYRNDEYAPFVAIDLGNLYKEEALYSKAIKIYEEALRLPAVKRNPSTKKEFANNLEYLRIVRDVLLRNHMLSMPFDKLSKEILQEIDTEFKKVQINSAQSK